MSSPPGKSRSGPRSSRAKHRNLGLRTCQRVGTGGRISGGKPFERSHIHYILANPIYAGRVRHKTQIFEGQHPAIIEPAIWEQVQKLLVAKAARERGSAQRAPRSPLAGKLFDETGDGLTPTHSQKNGKRLRYYISRRLIADRSRKHPDAWRLPAEQVERLLADLVRRHLHQPDAVTTLTRDLSATRIAAVAEALASVSSQPDCLAVVERANLRPGELTVCLSQQAMVDLLQCQPDQIRQSGLQIQSPFRMRRCGVELKLHIGEALPELDQTLVRNIVKARRWLEMIVEGRTFSEIAEAESTSKRRVQDVIDLALLAPEFLAQVASGKQPAGLTSDYLIKTGFPAIWSEQRQQFAGL